MKKTLLLCLILLSSLGAPLTSPAQNDNDVTAPETTKLFDLKTPVSDDSAVTWLDLARKIFPDARSGDNNFSRSNFVRFSPKHNVWYEIKTPMRILEAHSCFFEDEGKKRIAAFFKLENSDERKLNLFLLAVYDANKPDFPLLEAVDARLFGYEQTELAGYYSELAAESAKGAKETVHLVYRRQGDAATDSVEEKHRFLMLDRNRLRVVFDTPPLVSRTDCSGEIKRSFSVNRLKQLKSSFPGHQFVYERAVTPNQTCPNQKYYGVIEVESYRAEWDAARLIFRPKPAARGGYLTGAWGTYDPDEYEKYPGDATKLKISAGYRARAFYNPRTGNIRLAAPGKSPRGTRIEFEFEDYWGVSPSEAKSIVRGTIKFQIISEETVFLSGSRTHRKTLYHCLLYAFGKRSRFNNQP
ncbi:MAG TPA: hypothetical protein VF721_09305 [Pyrinomonadaceae bacterium]|jgi:hypothetical protein